MNFADCIFLRFCVYAEFSSLTISKVVATEKAIKSIEWKRNRKNEIEHTNETMILRIYDGIRSNLLLHRGDALNGNDNGRGNTTDVRDQSFVYCRLVYVNKEKIMRSIIYTSTCTDTERHIRRRACVCNTCKCDDRNAIEQEKFHWALNFRTVIQCLCNRLWPNSLRSSVLVLLLGVAHTHKYTQAKSARCTKTSSFQ